MKLLILTIAAAVLLSLAPETRVAEAAPPLRDELCFAAGSSHGRLCVTMFEEDDGMEICIVDLATEVETCVFKPAEMPLDTPAVMETGPEIIDV